MTDSAPRLQRAVHLKNVVTALAVTNCCGSAPCVHGVQALDDTTLQRSLSDYGRTCSGALGQLAMRRHLACPGWIMFHASFGSSRRTALRGGGLAE
eukprot:1220716-Alexandrium_andersonii.AAC.1